MKRLGKIALLLALWILLLSLTVYSVEIDTTHVREKPDDDKTLGRMILKTPQYVLMVPIKTLEGISKFTVNKIVSSKTIGRLKTLLSDVDRVWGFYPIVGYGSNSGLKGGLAFTSKQVFTKGERLKIKASYTTHDYQSYKIKYTAPNKFGGVKRPWFMAHYQTRPWESFYGIGNKSNEQDEVAFTLKETYFGLGWHHRLLSSLDIHFDGSYRILNTFDGEDPSLEGNLSQIQQTFKLSTTNMQAARIWSVGFKFSHDWRDHPGQPSRGGYESFTLTYNKGVNRSDDLKFLVTRVDVRHYLNLYKKRLLAFRILVEALDRMENSPQAPFYLRPSLGGGDDLRGYRTRRFTDNNLTLASVEYRYPIWDIVDAFIFLDEGRVFNSITDNFTFTNWHYSAGAGIRIWNNDGLILSTLAATSKEGARFYLEFSESF